MVRLGIVGAGIMGGHHGRIAAMLPNVDLVVVTDPDPAKGEALARNTGAVYSPSIADLPGQVDAAIVASPSEMHAEIGLALLDAGVDIMIEKPIATTVEDAKLLVAKAAETRQILMVGHVERFNPAVAGLPQFIDGLIHIDIRRVGPYSARVSTDVILDLMIHDVDLVRMLTGSEVIGLNSLARPVRSESADFATVLLRLANGVSATLTASRASQTKQRQIELTQRDNLVVADLLRRDVTVHRVEHEEFIDDEGSRYRQRAVIEVPYLDGGGEPLALEQRHFIECVEQRDQPMITGEDGLAALELALRIRSEALAGGAHV